MKTFQYTITDEIGIHARPARKLLQEARRYQSKIVVKKDGRSAETNGLMALMTLAVKCGETVTVEITGTDEEKAYDEMKKFFVEHL